MDPTRSHVSPPGATAVYSPPGGTDGRPAVELVAGSAPVSRDDLAPLLHKRLRFLVLVFTVFYAVVTVLLSVQSATTLQASRLNTWASTSTVVALLVPLTILSGRRRLTLRQLRGIEFGLFAVFVARMAFRAYALFWPADHMNRAHVWLAGGDVAKTRAMTNLPP